MLTSHAHRVFLRVKQGYILNTQETLISFFPSCFFHFVLHYLKSLYFQLGFKDCSGSIISFSPILSDITYFFGQDKVALTETVSTIMNLPGEDSLRFFNIMLHSPSGHI